MWNIIRLRMLKFRKDYPIMLIMTVLAIAFSFVFSLSQGSGGGQQTVGIINDSDSEFAAQVVREIDDSGSYRVVSASLEEMQELLKDLEVPFALYLSEDFDVDNRELTLYRSIETMEGLQAQYGVYALIDEAAVAVQASREMALILPGVDEDLVQRRILEDLERWPTYGLETRTIGRGIWQDFDFMMHLLIGFSVMFSMYTMIFGMGDILTDRRHLTFQRLMVSPVKKTQFIFGNLLASMFLGFVQMVIVLSVGRYLFDIDWGGHFPGILIVVLAFIFTVSAFGLLLSNIVRTMGQLGAVTPIIITGTAMLGGCMWPLEIVSSKVLLALSNLTPQKWAMVGIKNLSMYNMPLDSIVEPVGILLIMGAVFLVAGIGLLGRSELSFSR